jgi:hypothetical protein
LIDIALLLNVLVLGQFRFNLACRLEIVVGFKKLNQVRQYAIANQLIELSEYLVHAIHVAQLILAESATKSVYDKRFVALLAPMKIRNFPNFA